ncbi:acyl-homoserine-lactone synthase [Primorskyibacter sp. S87]|uniref:acyl-homoserine-lactone synthase n=1 Tax=Primorskyibacter sp. S87 TaxID=3415126 RepID=UPI003C7C9B0C
MNEIRGRFQTAPASLAFPELEPVTVDKVGHRPPPVPARKVSAPAKREPVSQTGQLKTTVMSFRNMHEHGDLLVKYLEARRAIFVDRLNWHVPESEGMEFDQYDTPFCRWVILHEFGEILGGVRLLPTTAQVGMYSYMLRDAQSGILVDIPTDVLFFRAPVEEHIWEASRFFITDKVPASRRLQVQNTLFEQMRRAAQSGGATHILGIVPAIWSRWARRLDVGATPIGAKFSIDGTVSQSVLFNTTRFVN